MKNEKMLKLFKDKKGINDISIIAVIFAIFLISALIIPYINSEFDTSYNEYDADGIVQDAKDDVESVNAISAFTVLVTVMKLGIYDFGNSLGLPLWMDALYTILAIIFILVIARNIWVGGGA